EGISWFSSQVGKPLNKYVREGLDIKVWLLRGRAIVCLQKLDMELDEGEMVLIEFVHMKVREYTRVFQVKRDCNHAAGKLSK
ncbi:hypothetical protein LINPERPRIM_LOCUS541, partial [Linum perenne]